MTATAFRSAPQRRQTGGIILLVCFALLFLLGFMGIALDFGRSFIVRNELQTALDSCALAAAQELDAQGDSITRAINAGTAAAAPNRVNLQSASWDDKGKLSAADFSFRDANYAPTTSPAAARYVECAHTQSDVRMWMLHFIGVADGNTAGHPATRNIAARAVATRASGQSACPVPVAMIAKNGMGAPDYGYQVGEWVVVKSLQGTANGEPLASGEMGWFNLDGSQSGKETKDELAAGALCGTTVAQNVTLTTKGNIQSAASVWNARFGLYKNGDTPALNGPDYSGFEYNDANWPSRKNAWVDYKLKRLAFTPHQGKSGSYDPISSAQHAQYGSSLRVVTVPVLQSGASPKVTDFACMLMLDPMKQPKDDVHMEYLGNAADVTSPCVNSGLAGYAGGPLVSVLVR